MNGEAIKPPQGPQEPEYKIDSEHFSALTDLFQRAANVKAHGLIDYSAQVELNQQANGAMNFVTGLNQEDKSNKGIILACSAAALGISIDRGMQDGIYQYIDQNGGLSQDEKQVFSDFASRLRSAEHMDRPVIDGYIGDQVGGVLEHARQLQEHGIPTDGLKIATLAMGAGATSNIDMGAQMLHQIQTEFVR